MKITFDSPEESSGGEEPVRPNEDLTSIEEDLRLLADIKAQIARLKFEADLLQERLCKEMETSGVIEDAEGNPVRVTKVQSAQTKVDLDELKKVNPSAWLRATKRVLDTAGFERVVADGTLTAESMEHLVASGAVWWKDNNPYLKFTRITTEEEKNDG